MTLSRREVALADAAMDVLNIIEALTEFHKQGDATPHPAVGRSILKLREVFGDLRGLLPALPQPPTTPAE